ncbi:hypothetical protein SDC9_149982 [bioreactor metagenome]|uniref:Uncharacterized protein n=1 Tax=bioreactor metagenome TaxID=1076179 RepID=A0A645EMU6_9ZZZZ
MERIFIGFSTIEHGFGWDTAFVKANAAQGFFLKQDHLQPFMACTFGSYVTGRSTADD